MLRFLILLALTIYLPFVTGPGSIAPETGVTPTATRVAPTATRKPTNTATRVGPTATRTPTVTGTRVGPTATRTPTATKTSLPPTATSVPPSATPTTGTGNPHAGITKYEGPQTCVACHAVEAEGALHSEHVQWQGKWEHVNTYCTAPEPADYACLNCHATTGAVKNLTVNDVDCLICHSNTYQRSLQPLSIPVTVVDWMGTTKTYYTPVKNSKGNYEFQPRYDLMPAGTTMESLAQNVGLPDRATCLRCHAKAGGGDGTKRGDLSTVSANPPLNSDVHMSPTGANLLCQDCHAVDNHKIAGKGIDLRISEGPTPTCQQCHAQAPHSNSQLNTHAQRVACQTCHIPTFAKDMPTEMSRDWTEPHYSSTACSGQGGWIGHEVKAQNVIPTYTFWNGQSSVYDLANPLSIGLDGYYPMAEALGTIQDGMLYPIKVHTSVQPRSDLTGRMVQYDVAWNFMTGFFDQAAQRGLAFMGLGGTNYSWVNTRAEQLITHGVSPAAQALTCDSCHTSRTQMDLRTLGYSLKASQSAVCTQCHGNEDYPGYTKVHSIHVNEEGYDCSNCHNFSRPERNLRIR